MNRKKFLTTGFGGLGSIIALPTLLSSCSKENKEGESASADDNCPISPTETQGPFPIKTPAQYVRENIVGNRIGIPLLVRLTIHDQRNGCSPLANVLVDVWQCDRDGLYSQYTNQTNANYLRGRQTTNSDGQVLFISIFPGWYPGRAPHLHVEVLTPDEHSLLITQIAFPVSTYSSVYTTAGYHGAPDTSNTQDSIFSDSLSGNMADSVTGNNTDGYTLLKTITVA